MPLSVRFNKAKEIKTFKEEMKVSGLKLDISQKKSWNATPKKNVIKYINNDLSSKGHVIGKIACSTAFATQDTLIRDLVPALNADDKLKELGVVGKSYEVKGVILRMELLNFLNKHYGKQILVNKTLKELLEDENLSDLIVQPPDFHFKRDVFSVIFEISDYLETTDKKRFLLTKRSGEYAGIFTNIDVLLYLSHITRNDIEQAADLQKRIVKEKTDLQKNDFHFIATSKMAKGVGGDFYIAKELTNNNWLFSLCDVSGKGVSAGLVTTLLGALFNIYDFNKGLKKFIISLNKYVHTSFKMDKFLTGFFGHLDTKSGKLVFYDMGHAYVYIYRQEKIFKVKSSESNIPLGFKPELKPVANAITMKENDILMVFTDGFEEQTNVYNEEYNMLGNITRLIKEMPFNTLTTEIDNDIDNFRGIQSQHDDMTLIMLKYTKSNPQ